MGRGRSSTNYNDAEKQLLLRAVASVKPRRASCWHAIETYYNAHRDPESRAVTRDAHSLKRKFKSMASMRAPRNAEFEDPYIARARQLMAEMKTRMAAGGNASAMDDDDDDDEEDGNGEYARESVERADAPMPAAPAPVPSTAYAGPTQEDGRRLPLLSPLLPAPAPTPSPTRSTRPAASTSSTRGSSAVVSADLTQVLLLMREENAQREATRRAEREEAIAREERLRAEASELRRQEREEAAAREERHWRELAEQRRLDREDAAARHEQMMVVLAALLKPTAATTAAAADAITRASTRANN